MDRMINAKELGALLRKHGSAFSKGEIVELSTLFYSSTGGLKVSINKFLDALEAMSTGGDGKVAMDGGLNVLGSSGRLKTHPLGIGTCASESQDNIRLVNFYTGTLCSYMDLKNLLRTIITLSSQHPSPRRCLCRPPPPSPAAPSRRRCNQMSPSTYAIIPPYRCRFPIVRGRQIKSSTNTVVVVVVVVVNARSPARRPSCQVPGQQIPPICRRTLALSLAYPGSSSRHVA
jgi:hypothetical protein